MTTRIFAATALACAAVAGLSGCASLGIGVPGSTAAGAQAAAGQLTSALDAFNTAAAQHCAGTGALDWTPPFPPTGSLHVQCVIGQQMVPLSQLSTLLSQPAIVSTQNAPAAPPASAAPK